MSIALCSGQMEGLWNYLTPVAILKTADHMNGIHKTEDYDVHNLHVEYMNSIAPKDMCI